MPYVVIILDEPEVAALLAHHFTKGSPNERIRLLVEQGVDDFIVKPCSVREVMARSRAVMRRAGRASGTGGGRES